MPPASAPFTPAVPKSRDGETWRARRVRIAVEAEIDRAWALVENPQSIGDVDRALRMLANVEWQLDAADAEQVRVELGDRALGRLADLRWVSTERAREARSAAGLGVWLAALLSFAVWVLAGWALSWFRPVGQRGAFLDWSLVVGGVCGVMVWLRGFRCACAKGGE